MTREDIEAAWLRYMHRADISPELPDVWTFAGQYVQGRIMRRVDPGEDLVAVYPALFLHAGLIYLHEWAQDDAGLQRESGIFDAACSAAVMAYSVQNVDPIMERG